MADPRFKRGAIMSPRHKLMAATPFKPRGTTADRFLMAPKTLSMWLNDQDGDCVTAEECMKIACALLSPEVVIRDEVLKPWIDKYDFANGATLTDVMDKMKEVGITQDDVTYFGGAYDGVDYSKFDSIANALCQGRGPVKIAIDANILPGGAGNASGFFVTGLKHPANNSDHCVCFCGFGPIQWLADQLAAQYGVTVAIPSGVDPNGRGAALYTWKTIGIVDESSVPNVPTEAWLRNPATIVNGNPVLYPTPTQPTPVPPTPTPTPAPSGLLAFILKALEGVNTTFGWLPGVTTTVNQLEAFFTAYLAKKNVGAIKLDKANAHIIQTIVDDMFIAANIYFAGNAAVLVVLKIAQPIIDALILNLP